MAVNNRGFENQFRYGGSGGYTSEFSEVDEDERKRNWRDDQLSGVNRAPNHTFGLPSKGTVTSEYDSEEAKIHRFHLLRLDAYSRHKLYINNYLKYYGGSMKDFKRDGSYDKTDHDILKEEHRFVWSDEDDDDSSWRKRLARKYYDKLFKEYCISDLRLYKENKVALRWRVEKEVVSGKGQFICGNKTCNVTSNLQSWEVNFSYREHGEKKNALVKLRLCPECSVKLNYHHKRKAVKRKSREERKSRKEKRSSGERKSNEERELKKSKRSRRSDDANDHQPSESGMEKKDESLTDLKTQSSGDIWKKPAIVTVDKTREEEFDDYFEDMFL
ncbi:protein FRA10AC1-like isoform X2 [Xenia sp. Carnegie-2017]|uniref:protein FRA10AC1-like isoform X2 n=1 Tax=Xenia sp. Carnegie-2017 TaxID=2897299 RepID=UPI001F0458EA|nr:protein FRA10AC1-like isoform X2 [Xenia sp. Carnegie-2017]